MTARHAAAEFLGTALLLAVVVGSGIMGERLAGGNAAVALLANSIATGAGLFALICLFAPVSGAHFNPVVTASLLANGTLGKERAACYIAAQVLGAGAGVVLAHAMFGLNLIQASQHARDTAGEFIGEIVATSGLLLAIRLPARAPLPQAAATVALWITAAYWFTSSTSFANPAVTIARAMTDSFAGIAPASVAGFIAAQLLGAVLAHVTLRFLEPARVHPAE